MNEPVKKMDQTPESYSPKIKPWIVNLVEKVTVEEAEEMKQNHSVKLAKLEYLHLPALRFIGKDVISSGPDAGNQYGLMWAKSGEIFSVLDQMENYASLLRDNCALMHHDNLDGNHPMHYIVGRFMKAESSVPEGFDYYDIPASCAALAIYYGEFNDMIDQAYTMTRDRILADGRGIPYPVGYYHAEVYVPANIPKDGVVSQLGYLFSCNKDNQNERTS